MVRQSQGVWLISDREDWIQSAGSALGTVNPLGGFVYRSWEALNSAGGLSVDPGAVPRLMCWDLCAAEHALCLQHYANWYQQYNSLVHIAVDGEEERGSLACRMSEVGYRHILIGDEGIWGAFTVAAGEVLRSSVNLVPAVAQGLSIRKHRLADAIAAVLADATTVRTVDGWGRLLGHSDRHTIEAWHREERLPRPWAVLAWMRLIAAVDWASRESRPPKVSQVARHFKYCSAYYLNLHAANVTGRDFSDLLEFGPRRLVRLMARWAAESRRDRSVGTPQDDAGGRCSAIVG